MALERYTMPNGLTIYNDSIDSARTNSVRMYVPYGSYHEQPGHEGIAHVFEHSLFLQTEEFKTEVGFDRFAKLHGMDHNAITSYTDTNYMFGTLHLDPSFHCLSQLLRHAQFSDGPITHELKAIRRELADQMGDIELVHELATNNAMFGLPFGRDIGGLHNNVNFSTSDIEQLYQRYYQIGHMSLIVTGKSHLDEIIELADRYFGDAPAPTTAPATVPHAQPGAAYHTGTIVKFLESAHISLSYPLTGDLYNTVAGNTLLYSMAESAMSDHAFERLRQDEGLSYDGSIEIDLKHRHASLIGGDVTTDANDVPHAVDVLHEVFTKPSQQYSDDQLIGTLANHAFLLNKAYSSEGARMSRIVQSLGEDTPLTDLDDDLRQVEAITIDDIRNAIDTIVNHTSTTQPYIHVTGNKKAVGKADRIIKPKEVM